MLNPARILLAAILAACGLTVLTSTYASADVTTPTRVDAQVYQGSPTSNYGTATTMALSDASQKRYGYVKFDVPTTTEQVTGVILNVYVSTSVANSVLTVDRVSNNWTETGLTYNTQPPVTTSNVGSVTLGSPGWYSIPVTGVTPGSVASFRLRTSTFCCQVVISTRENANGNDAMAIVLTTPPPPTADFRFGLNTAATDWDTTFADLNSAGGITVRRIFATTTNEQLSQVNDAVSAGMIPWVSIKLNSTAITNPSSASTLVTQYANDYAAALPPGGVMYATIWHEANNGDMTAAQYGNMQNTLAPILASHSNIKVGGILTSFQLVNNITTDDGPNFLDFLTQEKPLLANGTFSFFGIDAYEDDSLVHEPYENLAATETALNNAGVASTVPVYIGEFQTHPNQGTQMQDTVNAFLADPRLKVACLFLNASKWLPFEAARKTPFKAALLNSRVIH